MELEENDDGQEKENEENAGQEEAASRRQDDEQFIEENAVPAPKQERGKSICSRTQIVIAVAWVILRAFREGRSPLLAELVDGSGLLPSYPTRSGGSISVGDAIGQNGGHAAKLWRANNGAIRRVRENVANLMKAIPVSARQGVVEKAGCVDIAELVAVAKTLQSAVDG